MTSRAGSSFARSLARCAPPALRVRLFIARLAAERADDRSPGCSGYCGRPPARSPVRRAPPPAPVGPPALLVHPAPAAARHLASCCAL
jgi:hypothetical protein